MPFRQIQDDDVGVVVDDLMKALPTYRFDTVIDVGANIGQTTLRMREKLSNCIIHALEPVPDAFWRLRESTQGVWGINAHGVALGSSAGIVQMEGVGHSTSNRVVERLSDPTSISVKMMTGDAFCVEQEIGKVSFLKVDTEGHDLEVIRGFNSLISNRNIDIIQVEASMNDRNKRHIHIGEFLDYFRGRGFDLFCVYSQRLEKRRAILRRANLVFISEKVSARI